jgi:hypothetical protein
VSSAAVTDGAAVAPVSRPKERLSAGGLRIGAPDDVFEREAERMADAVVKGVAMPQWSFARTGVDAPLQRKCACGGSGGGECETCREKRLHRQEAQSRTPEIVDEVLSSPGRPLDPLTREQFEGRFGRNFGDVRVHAEAKAAQSAAHIGALAYTNREHIVFGAGQYAPDSDAGDRLLAHELTHVVQQSTGFASSAAVQRQADPKNSESSEKPPKTEFTGCSEDLQADLQEKHRIARSQVAWAVTSIAGGQKKMAETDKANFNRYFDPSNSGDVDDDFVRDVRSNFQRIGSYLGSITFDCDPESASICGDSKKWCVGSRQMWTCFGNLHVCVDNYKKLNDDDFKIENIIHESTHNALHTTDRAYTDEAKFQTLKPRGSGILAFLSKIPVIGAIFKLFRSNNDTLNNPDSYAMYAMSNRAGSK